MTEKLIAGDEDHIITGSELASEETYSLAHHAPRPIALHTVSDLLARYKSSPRIRAAVLAIDDHHKTTDLRPSLLIDPIKIGLITKRRITGHQSSPSLLGGQALSASGSSSLEDLTAGSRSHSLSESVLLKSLSLLWLISSLHNVVLLSETVQNIPCPLNSTGIYAKYYNVTKVRSQ